jgi:putative tryptophan/tyrosine transport system substrate-binding protein
MGNVGIIRSPLRAIVLPDPSSYPTITLFGGAAAAWPLAARGQETKLPTIGFIGAGTPSTYSQWVAAFVQRLRKLGRIEGGNLAIEYRWGEGRSERYPEIAAEFVRLKVDVIVTVGTSATIAAKQATSVVPIVFVGSGDPIGVGIVATLARPGGNITGLTNQGVDLIGKRVELLREVVPRLRRLGILGHAGNATSAIEMGEVQSAARALGIEVTTPEIRRPEDIAPAFEAFKGRAEAIYVASDPLLNSNRVRINTLALDLRLPTQYSFREYVEAGGLMSYGPSFPAQFQRAAELVDQILSGTKPADIPVEQPTKFDLVINLTTARALGLTVSPMLLARADEVIE